MKKLKALLETYTCAHNAMVVKWRLSDQCNYRCSYCLRNSEKQWMGDKRDLDYDTKKDEKMLCKASYDITKMINKIKSVDRVKVDIIGGEPSIYNLEKVFEGIVKNNKKVEQINITTNISRSAEYYISLFKYISDNGINLTMTASLHPEFTTIDKYFEKVTKVQDAIGSAHINCEIVSLPGNFDLVSDFRERCKKYDLDYKIEKDIRNKTDLELVSESSFRDKICYYKYDKVNETIDWSLEPKDNYEICNGKYLIIYEDGSTESVGSRNELFNKDDIDELVKPNLVNTGEFYCTNSIKFVNIIGDQITSCKFMGAKQKISDFEPFDWDESNCTPGIQCSLCGSISISKDISLIKGGDS